jgi:aspartyl-tRNA(Asn)/glutamyl-tRNA(Gln) amidotransferase subunit C
MSDSAHMDVRKTADLARLRLTDAETTAFSEQLGRILGYISALESVETTDVPPTAHPSGLMDVLRPDIARPGLGATAALQNAPRHSGDQFLVPKVMDAS